MLEVVAVAVVLDQDRLALVVLHQEHCHQIKLVRLEVAVHRHQVATVELVLLLSALEKLVMAVMAVA
jgi:hypothetical protein